MPVYRFATRKPFFGGYIEATGETPEAAYEEMVRRDPNTAWAVRGLSKNKKEKLEAGWHILGNSHHDPFYIVKEP